MFRRDVVWLGFSVGVVASACALPACSLLLGEGFTDPNAELPANDAGTGALDGPTNEGGGSTPATEGGPGTDGSRPSTDGGDGGGCPVAAVSFCDDFERVDEADVKGPWDVAQFNASGSLMLGTGLNGNHHLAASISALGGHAELSKIFTKLPAKVHFELSLTVKAFASVGAVHVAGLDMNNGIVAPSLVYLFVTNTTLYLVQQVADGGGYTNNALPVSLGNKHRIVVDLTFNGKITASVDGTTRLDTNAQTYLVPNPPGFHVGASSIDGTGDDGSFEVDDVVFTID